MTLNTIITELETIALHQNEVNQTAEGLHAAVHYFFDQLDSKTTWSRSELDELSDQALIKRCLTQLGKALGLNEE